MCLTFFKNWFSEMKEADIVQNTIEEEEVFVGAENPTDTEETEVSESEPETDCSAGHMLSSAKRVYVVLLDNGHAFSTKGKRSPKLEDGTQFFEYEFTRDIVSRITDKLNSECIRYEIITPEVIEDVPLKTRAARANSYCKRYGKDNCLFISIHSNAFGMGDTWEKPEGWSVWTCKGETKSDDIAKMFYEEAEKIVKPAGYHMRDGKVQGGGNPGPDYEANFTVLTDTICPAILTENMFYTSKKDVVWLLSEEGREAIAEIHFNGIKRWLESKE